MVLVLEKEDAINALLDIVGPEDPLEGRITNEFSIRAMYGRSRVDNVVHVSPSYAMSAVEMKTFFPLTKEDESAATRVLVKGGEMESPLNETSCIIVTPRALRDGALVNG